jgi:DNA-binding GntR family transcriptional regulator
VSDLSIVVDRSSPVPLYFQLVGQLEAAIADGRLAKGSFLGNEIDLAAQWQVSRPTVRQAMQSLVDGGLLVRRRGVGTQVVSEEVRRPARLTSLFDDLSAQGLAPRTQVLTFDRVAADATVSTALGIGAGVEVVFIERCRLAAGRRLAVMRNWLLAEVAEGIAADDLRTRGLYELFRSRGVRPHQATQQFGARLATPVDAALLGLAVGAPLLTMRRVMQDQTGRAVELGVHAYDAMHYTVEMTVLEA